MRITVGGVLLFSGAAAMAAVGPFKFVDPTKMIGAINGLKDSAGWVMDYFKLEDAESKAVEVVAAPVVESAPVSAPEPVAPAPVEGPPVMEPVAAPVVAPVQKKRSRRRRAKKAPVASKAAKPAAPALVKTKAAATNGLVGTYVAVKLKTGREVKGVLQSQTVTEYTIEIPGMGPFQYPAANVLSVVPAE